MTTNTEANSQLCSLKEERVKVAKKLNSWLKHLGTLLCTLNSRILISEAEAHYHNICYHCFFCEFKNYKQKLEKRMTLAQNKLGWFGLFPAYNAAHNPVKVMAKTQVIDNHQVMPLTTLCDS